MLAIFYLIDIGDRGVWLGLSILFGFVLVWGWLSYREAKGTVIRVTERGLSLPPSATRSRSERLLPSSEIRQVCLILLRSRRGDKRLSILEIEQANGDKLRLWPSMVSTKGLARAMERHMGLTVSSRSGLVYQVIVGILAFVLLFAIAYILSV
jgi:hypothetical protein